MRRLVVLVVGMLVAGGGYTQTAASPGASGPPGSMAPAVAQPAELFDFWLGDWKLSWRDADGSAGTGRNRITKILDGSVIEESFEALPGSTPPLLKGRSLSVLSNGVWRQAWADNQGGFFAFTGRAEGDNRIFITATVHRDGKAFAQRMVFHSIRPDALTWDWESTADDGQTWALQWRVLYTR